MAPSKLIALLVNTVVCVSRAHAVTIETVPVGNLGNAGDLQSQGTFGAVPYYYRIGRTEVTNAQYTEFLNGVDATGANPLGLYESRMSSESVGGINFNGGAANGSKYTIKSGRDNNPVVFVSWFDAIRFTNWLHNGQDDGDTENGAYTIQGAMAIPFNANSITRNAGAKWWLPSEDEWYKAAYHKNDGVTGNYWNYQTTSDAVPFSDQPPGSDAPDPTNVANHHENDGVANGYNDGFGATGSASFFVSQNYLTDVGAYTLATSAYGTFDQGGNVAEFTETRVGGSSRVTRGGSWSTTSGVQPASSRNLDIPSLSSGFGGFRVATVPEPSTLLLGALAGMGLWWPRRPAARDFRRVI